MSNKEEEEKQVYMLAQEELGRSSAFMLFSLDSEGRMNTLGYTPRSTEAVGLVDLILDYISGVYDKIHQKEEDLTEEEGEDA